jgi:hypothetical protein
MDRRANLKVLLSGTIATGFLLSTGCSQKGQKGLFRTKKGWLW